MLFSLCTDFLSITCGPAAPWTRPAYSAAAMAWLTCWPRMCTCRVAFWRQVQLAQQQPAVVEQAQLQPQQTQAAGVQGCNSSALAYQMHQLAWSSILVTSSSQQRQHQQQLQQPVCCIGQAEGPLAAVKQQLRTYLAAHMQWRQQQQAAPPLAPAEKWVTLEHEEQVSVRHLFVHARVHSHGSANTFPSEQYVPSCLALQGLMAALVTNCRGLEHNRK